MDEGNREYKLYINSIIWLNLLEGGEGCYEGVIGGWKAVPGIVSLHFSECLTSKFVS